MHAYSNYFCIHTIRCTFYKTNWNTEAEMSALGVMAGGALSSSRTSTSDFKDRSDYFAAPKDQWKQMCIFV